LEGAANRLPRGVKLAGYVDITEAELGWIMGCLLLLALVIGYPSIMTALAVLREQRVLGRLYWHLRTALDRRRDDGGR
jgi:hypothetical protein